MLLSKPPYILGNFPRIEIVFAVVDRPEESGRDAADGEKYDRLAKLKKLLDEGALTQEEFEREKDKLLNR